MGFFTVSFFSLTISGVISPPKKMTRFLGPPNRAVNLTTFWKPRGKTGQSKPDKNYTHKATRSYLEDHPVNNHG